MALHLRLINGVEQCSDGDDLLLIAYGSQSLRLRLATDGQRHLLHRLAEESGTFRDLLTAESSLSSFMLLQQLEKRGLISLSLQGENGPWISLTPTCGSLARCYAPRSEIQIQWSSYLQITPQKNGLRLEVPMNGSHVLLQDQRLSRLIMDLAKPLTTAALAALVPEELQEEINDVVMLFLSAGIAGIVDQKGELSCDGRANSQRWSREDLAVHHRSREGWHGEILGSSFRGANLEALPPMVRTDSGQERIDLPKPLGDETDPGFFSVLERRCSIRESGRTPITINQLGRLLWASLRVKRRFQAYQGTPEMYEAASRPVGSGGGIHEIDTYLLIHRCAGIANGLYRYDPINHQLVHIDRLNSYCEQLTSRACQSSGMQGGPDILCILAARYDRVSWRYEGCVYALILKHAGVIMQQLYLVATALGLAPCSIGGGDSRLFEQATGLDRFADVPVGEFMISGGPIGEN